MATPAAKDRLIAGYQDLDSAEQLCAQDIVDAYNAALAGQPHAGPMWAPRENDDDDDDADADDEREPAGAGPSPHPPSPLSTKAAWDLVFAVDDDGRPWTTAQPIPRPTLPAPPSHADLAVHTGVFTQDLPPSRCAVRNASRFEPKNSINDKKKRKAKARAKQGQQVMPRVGSSRLAGEPAFLRARPSGGSSSGSSGIDWFWTDSHGKAADAQFVQDAPHYGQRPVVAAAQSRAMAVVNHDDALRSHARACNRLRLVDLMRRRLVRFAGLPAGHAQQQQQRPTNPSAADAAAAFTTPVLLAPAIIADPDADVYLVMALRIFENLTFPALRLSAWREQARAQVTGS